MCILLDRSTVRLASYSRWCIPRVVCKATSFCPARVRRPVIEDNRFFCWGRTKCSPLLWKWQLREKRFDRSYICNYWRRGSRHDHAPRESDAETHERSPDVPFWTGMHCVGSQGSWRSRHNHWCRLIKRNFERRGSNCSLWLEWSDCHERPSTLDPTTSARTSYQGWLPVHYHYYFRILTPLVSLHTSITKK